MELHGYPFRLSCVRLFVPKCGLELRKKKEDNRNADIWLEETGSAHYSGGAPDPRIPTKGRRPWLQRYKGISLRGMCVRRKKHLPKLLKNRFSQIYFSKYRI